MAAPAPQRVRLQGVLASLWFAMAGWFLWSGAGPDPAAAAPARAEIPASALDPLDLRASLGDPPTIFLGGVEQRCSDCHALIPAREIEPEFLMQHRHIRLDHGRNDRCTNCHDLEDKNSLVLRDGTTLGFARSTELCGSCHGTLLRDWERGIHGRSRGSWDTASPERSRLRCVDCHDPHRPAFGSVEPLPGPRPAREAGDTEAPHPIRNPLERWKEHR